MSSKRQYIDSTYLSTFLSGIALNTDFASTDDLINTAEELIDSYVGAQPKWFQATSMGSNGVYTAPDTATGTKVAREIRGRVSSIQNSTTFTLMNFQQNVFQQDYLAMCNIELIGGTGAGQTNLILGSLFNGQVTVKNAWTTPPDTTTVYRIYQLGKFPRIQDVYYDSIDQPPRYYKTIPDAVRRATASQALYINEQGRGFFMTDSSSITGEHLGSYSYTRKSDGADVFISPEAQEALKGITNRTGRIKINGA